MWIRAENENSPGNGKGRAIKTPTPRHFHHAVFSGPAHASSVSSYSSRAHSDGSNHANQHSGYHVSNHAGQKSVLHSLKIHVFQNSSHPFAFAPWAYCADRTFAGLRQSLSLTRAVVRSYLVACVSLRRLSKTDSHSDRSDRPYLRVPCPCQRCSLSTRFPSLFSDTDRRAMLLVGLGPPGESRREDIAIAVVDKSDQGPSLIFSDSRQKSMHFWIVFGVI